SRIWKSKPSSATVVYRFLEFEGIGPKISTMNANILARHFKIEFSDYYSVDVSSDVHVRRVFERLGLIPAGASNAQVIFRARSLHPSFPGLMDFPAWDIGRQWREKKPILAFDQRPVKTQYG
ncbi:MAG: iron-sulfur cluster loop, partial [Gammaproteobacteria bacterium]|nr:iron-sulfur cluster loop [Gammaproteobacteria bacterium]